MHVRLTLTEPLRISAGTETWYSLPESNSWPVSLSSISMNVGSTDFPLTIEKTPTSAGTRNNTDRGFVS